MNLKTSNLGHLLLCFLCYCSSRIGAADINTIQNLRKTLLHNYDGNIIPNNVTVQLLLKVLFIEVNDDKHLVTAHAWVFMEWTDPRLKWNPDEHGSVTTLAFPHDSLWIPDVLLYNNADEKLADHYHETMPLVSRDGTIRWAPRSVLWAKCPMDLRLWPFDHQTCFAKFGSWVHDGWQLNLELSEKNADISSYTPNPEWELEGNITGERDVKFYACCEEPYVSITYTLMLQRNSATYAATIITPAFALIVLTLVTFWLPPKAPERLAVGLVNILFSALYLQYLGTQHLNVGDNAPLIVLFFRDSLAMVTVSVVLTVIFSQLQQSSFGVLALPPVVQMLLNGWGGKILCLQGHFKRMLSTPLVDEEEADSTTSPQKRVGGLWAWLIPILDRLLFCIYLITFLVFIFSFL